MNNDIFNIKSENEPENKLIYQCPQCNLTFSRPESFKKHVKKIHFKDISACRKCTFFSEKLSELFLHAREIHNKRTTTGKLKCHVCSYTTDNGGLLKHHYRSHSNYQPYKCEICNKRFTQKSNMKTHFNRHKNNKFNFKCDPCDKRFNSHDIYLSHLETREHFLGEASFQIKVESYCMVCRDVFDNPNDAFEHQAKHGFQEMDQIACNKCFKSLPYDLEAITNHYKSHRNFICPLCVDDNYFDISSFNNHLTKVHQNRCERRKVCRYCETVFENEEIRNQHIELDHPNFKNTHRNAETNGRIFCGIGDCDFKTNSEILRQKHWQVTHNKNLDLDDFYKLEPTTELDNNDMKENARKRGRPRLCDTSEILDESDSPTMVSEMKKRRGRPPKSDSLLDQSESTNGRKRGRPKKLKVEPNMQNETECFQFQEVFDGEACNFKIEDIEESYLENVIFGNLFPAETVYNPLMTSVIKEEEIETLEA